MRKTFGVFCAVAMMLPIGIIAAAPAGAVTVTQCGVAKGTAYFKPPLPKLGSSTKVKSKLTSTGTVSLCKGGGVTKGTTKFSQTSASTGANCTTLVQPKATDKPTVGVLTTTWNTGKVSTAKSTAIKQTDATHATITGKITSGLFLGKTVKGTVEFTPESGGCTSKNLSKVTYVNKNAQHTVVKFVIG
jgi:hypothetical protein